MNIFLKKFTEIQIIKTAKNINNFIVSSFFIIKLKLLRPPKISILCINYASKETLIVYDKKLFNTIIRLMQYAKWTYAAVAQKSIMQFTCNNKVWR